MAGPEGTRIVPVRIYPAHPPRVLDRMKTCSERHMGRGIDRDTAGHETGGYNTITSGLEK